MYSFLHILEPALVDKEDNKDGNAAGISDESFKMVLIDLDNIKHE